MNCSALYFFILTLVAHMLCLFHLRLDLAFQGADRQLELV